MEKQFNGVTYQVDLVPIFLEKNISYFPLVSWFSGDHIRFCANTEIKLGMMTITKLSLIVFNYRLSLKEILELNPYLYSKEMAIKVGEDMIDEIFKEKDMFDEKIRK